jgi:hypothetical protein
LGFCADLRREINWGNLNYRFFGVLLVGPRGPIEEGGTIVCILGELIWHFPMVLEWGDQLG